MKKSALPHPGFLGFLLLLTGLSAHGQSAPVAIQDQIRTISIPASPSLQPDSIRPFHPFRLFSPVARPGYRLLPVLPGGWFCRQEWKLEKSTGIPFRFRLGSLEQVNWLERKPNALPPHLLR